MFLRYYKKFDGFLANADNTNSNLAEIGRLKDLACIWNKQDGHVSLDKPACFYKSITKEETVPPYILNLPNMLNKFPKLVEMFDFPDMVTFDTCVTALEGLSKDSKPNTKLSDVQLSSFQSLYKFFLYEDVLSESLPSVQFYAPNSEGILHKLQDLYYDLDGTENFEYVASSIQSDLMFNIEFVRMKYLTTSGRVKQGDSSLKKTAVFKEMNSWERAFSSIPYFLKYPALAARPLSDLIECRIKEVDARTSDVDETGAKLDAIIK